MRLTVAKKIIIGIALVLLLAGLALLAVYDGLARAGEAMRQFAEVQEPSHSAALEVELNLNGILFAVVAYLDDPRPRHRKQVEKDQQDIARFHARFLRLAESEDERRLGSQLGILYEELRTLTNSLLDTRDQQETDWDEFNKNFERADSIIDGGLQASVDPRIPGAAVKLKAFNDLEVDLAEMGVWLDHYQRAHDPEIKELIATNAGEFRRTLGRLRTLPGQAGEARQLAALSQTFDATLNAVERVLTLQDRLRRETARLLRLGDDMELLLDEEIQPLGRQRLHRPREAAERAAATVLERIKWLIPFLLVIALTTAAVLIRSISRPLRRLKAGVEAVGRGDLDHRIALRSRDEFAAVATAFDRMAEQLQETTVSKGLLERSERQLRKTVEQLREEMVERSRLEASLRRSETMSMMGALVAGVAHEVRNPLFGILSVLDALEARFSARQEFQRYLAVLREQADRLNRLMRELLEYGKPPTHELTPGSVAEVLAEALACAGPVAERAGVRLTSEIADGLSRVPLDRNRLLRVFVNLLENAINHTPPGGIVALESRLIGRPQDYWIECTVTDTGPGFRDEDLAHIFQPFFTRRRGGTGLGLSIAQQIVEEHHGQIAAANRPEGGAIMAVRLPASAAEPSVSTAYHAEA